MSERADQSFHDWKDLASSMRGIHFKHSQGTISTGDQLICADVLTLWCALVADLVRLHVFLGESLPEIDRRMSNLLHSTIECLEVHPVDEFLDVLKHIDESILTESFRSCENVSSSFKQMMRSLPKGFNWIGNFLIWAIPWADPVMGLSFTHQICSFPLRLNIRMQVLEEKGLTDWIATQSTRPAGLGFKGLRSIIQGWLSNIDLTTLHPSHGPGVARDCENHINIRAKQDKYTSSRFTPVMSYVDVKFYANQLTHPFGKKVDCEDYSQLQFVPKSYAKYRSIAVEPSGKMWYQQAVREVLDQLFCTDSYLRRRIRLHDASFNMDLAREGSICGDYATIDLSSASDCVTWELVKECTRSSKVFPLILASRTRKVLLPSGEMYELKSCATMGSAMCFPLECLVFAAIVEQSILDQGHDPRRSHYSVYGDDIVVETRYAPAVLRNLALYGFIPNVDKTFVDRSTLVFRESCGGEYVNGVDVTPLRISRFFAGFPSEVGTCTSEQFAELVDLANRSFDYYPTVRRLCLDFLLKLPKHLRPVFSVDEMSLKDIHSRRKAEIGGVIKSHTATNFHLHLDKRLSKRYQRPVYVHGIVGTDPPFCSESVEPIRLYDWLANSHKQAQDVYLGALPRGATVTKPEVPSLRRSKK